MIPEKIIPHRFSGNTIAALIGSLCLFLALLWPTVVNSASDDKVSIQLKWFHQFQFAGYYAAVEKGYYAEEGLEVELNERDPSVNNVDQVLNGESEYGVADTGLNLARQQGQPVVLLAQIFQHSPLVFLTARESGLRTPYNLKGKRVMFDPAGANDAPLMALIVETLGRLDAVESVRQTFNPEELSQGRVDAMLAYATDQPFWFKSHGFPVNIIDPRDYGIDFYGDNLFTTDEEIRKHPERVEKVRRATLKGWTYALENKNEIIDLILEKYNTQNFTREHLVFEAEQTEKLINPRFVEIGHFEPSRFQKVAGIYTQLGLADKFTFDDGFFYQPQIARIELTPEESAWLKAHPKIRLGVDPNYPPFEFIGRSGDYAGMAADYLALINEHLGTDMQIVPELSWSEVIDRAKKHEIDALPTLAKTEERSAYLNFTQPYMKFPVVFLSRKDQEPVSDFNDLSGRKLALVKDYFYVEEVRRKYPDIEPYFVKTPLEAMNALSAGEVDATIANFAVANHLILKHGLGSIRMDSETDLVGSEFGYGVRKDWPELVGILNKALTSISEEKHREIHDRWIAYDPRKQWESGKKVELTPEESVWLEAHPEIEIGVDGAWPPIDFMDGEGIHSGIAADYLELIGQRLGIRFQARSFASFGEMLNKVKDGTLNVGATISNKGDRGSYLYFTDPYFKVRYVIITSDDKKEISNLADLAGLTVAVEDGYWILDKLKTNYPNINLVTVKNTREALEHVSWGKADAYVGNQVVSFWLAQDLQLTNLTVAANTGFPPNPQRFAVHKKDSLLPLVGLINKALASIDVSERRVIEQVWLSGSKEKKTPRVALTEEERAWLQDTPMIRVHNEMSWPPFNFNEEGQARGLSIDFMDLLASKVGMEIEYVSGPSWNEFLEMMKLGDLDVMLNIVKTPEREKYLLYTPPYVDNPNTILSREDVPYQDIEQLFGKTVSVPKGFFYEEVLKRDYPKIKILAVKDTLESMKAVSFGKADAAFGEFAVFNHLMTEHMMTGLVVSGEVEMGNPEFTLLNIATRKDLPILASILKKGMAAITEVEKRVIYSDWIAMAEKVDSIGPNLGLTEEEKQWLEAHQTISVVDDFAWPPFTFQDGDGKFAGIAASYFEMFTEKLGVKFQPQFGRSWAEALDAIKSRKSDILPSLIRTPEREEYMNFTRPFISFPVILATRIDSPFIDGLNDMAGKRVGVVKGYLIEKRLTEGFPQIQVTPFANVAEGVEALAEGKVDAFAGNLGVISYEKNRLGLDDIKVAAPTSIVDELSFGVRKDWPELVSILNKVIDSMTAHEKAAIKNTWMGITVQLGTQLTTVFKWAIPILLIGFVIITFIVIWNRRLKNEVVERIEAERRQDELVFELNFQKYALDQHAIVSIGDTEGNITYVNDHFCDTSGYTKEELLGQNHRMLKSGQHSDGFYKEMWETISSGQTWHSEVCNKRKGGRLYWVDASMVPFMGDTGPERYISIQTDITERKMSEEAVKQAEERSRLLLESVGEGIFGIGEDGLVNFINPEASKLLGYDADELLGQKTHPIIHHTKADGCTYPIDECPMYKSSTEGTFHKVDDELLWRKDGSSFPAQYSSVPIYKEGKLSGAVVLFSDITERISIQRDMDQFKNTLDRTLDCVFMFDSEELSFIYANEGALQQVGYTHDELMTMHPYDIKPDISVEEFKDLINPLLSGDKASLTFETVHQHKNGQKIEVEIFLQYMSSENEESRFVAIVRDITERKRAEEELQIQQQRLDMALQGANAGFWDWSVTSGELITGDTWNSMLGYSREELDERYGDTAERFGKLLHPDDAAFVWEQVQKHVDGKTELYKTEFRMLTADGSWKWILDIGKASERDADGKGKRLVGIHLDIDETKKLEAEILNSKNTAEETSKKLQLKLDEQERFERLVVGRELKMIELKKEINQLLQETGKDKRYKTENAE